MADFEEYQEFKSLLKAANAKLGKKALADALGISITTLNLWLKGANLPHIAMLSPLIIFLRTV